jgi:hypothetical protein
VTLGGRSNDVDEAVLRGSGSGKTAGKVAKVERRSVTCDSATKSKSRVDDARSGRSLLGVVLGAIGLEVVKVEHLVDLIVVEVCKLRQC